MKLSTAGLTILAVLAMSVPERVGGEETRTLTVHLVQANNQSPYAFVRARFAPGEVADPWAVRFFDEKNTEVPYFVWDSVTWRVAREGRTDWGKRYALINHGPGAAPEVREARARKLEWARKSLPDLGAKLEALEQAAGEAGDSQCAVLYLLRHPVPAFGKERLTLRIYGDRQVKPKLQRWAGKQVEQRISVQQGALGFRGLPDRMGVVLNGQELIRSSGFHAGDWADTASHADASKPFAIEAVEGLITRISVSARTQGRQGGSMDWQCTYWLFPEGCFVGLEGFSLSDPAGYVGGPQQLSIWEANGNITMRHAPAWETPWWLHQAGDQGFVATHPFYATPLTIGYGNNPFTVNAEGGDRDPKVESGGNRLILSWWHRLDDPAIVKIMAPQPPRRGGSTPSNERPELARWQPDVDWLYRQYATGLGESAEAAEAALRAVLGAASGWIDRPVSEEELATRLVQMMPRIATSRESAEIGLLKVVPAVLANDPAAVQAALGRARDQAARTDYYIQLIRGHVARGGRPSEGRKKDDADGTPREGWTGNPCYHAALMPCYVRVLEHFELPFRQQEYHQAILRFADFSLELLGGNPIDFDALNATCQTEWPSRIVPMLPLMLHAYTLKPDEKYARTASLLFQDLMRLVERNPHGYWPAWSFHPRADKFDTVYNPVGNERGIAAPWCEGLLDLVGRETAARFVTAQARWLVFSGQLLDTLETDNPTAIRASTHGAHTNIRNQIGIYLYDDFDFYRGLVADLILWSAATAQVPGPVDDSGTGAYRGLELSNAGSSMLRWALGIRPGGKWLESRIERLPQSGFRLLAWNRRPLAAPTIRVSARDVGLPSDAHVLQVRLNGPAFRQPAEFEVTAPAGTLALKVSQPATIRLAYGVLCPEWPAKNRPQLERQVAGGRTEPVQNDVVWEQDRVEWPAVPGVYVLRTATAKQAQPDPARSTHVPRWDARDLGPLPRQGIACLDVNNDASRIVLGTIAPAGDPNVVQLDGDGRIIRTHMVGQRWIQDVALDGRGTGVHALCTMPAGRAGDFCSVFRCEQDVTPATGSLGQEDFALNLFQYGDHSNHCGPALRASAPHGVAVLGPRIFWLTGDAGGTPVSRPYPRGSDAVTTAFAAGPDGQVAIGCTSRLDARDDPGPNLFLLDTENSRPLWARAALADVSDTPAPERGVYGTPTLPDGRRDELPQHDVRVSAPLSLALDARPGLRFIATADYPGWQRWVRSSATLRDQNQGTRFLPTRPTVTIYDARGAVVRRFRPESFPHPGWVDLKFMQGGRRLLAYPHHWTSRGLAGEAVLPADDDARSLLLLDVETGAIHALEFPDAISDVDASDSGRIIVGCWDHQVYLLDAEQVVQGERPAGIAVGGPSLVRLASGGTSAIVATTSGTVCRLDQAGRDVWRTDLAAAIPPNAKPWVTNARAEPIAPGVWKLPGGRVESDLGGQWLIEAPEGLILIEGHAGLSFEREWAAIAAAGLDPRQVKYVLATHEHGDHAPGAYLWRITTGAQFVASAEMAYGLQHHIPLVSGYGFHPPVRTDVVVTEDTALELAGLRIHAVRVPGHTFGSMAWLFEKGGKRYVATGDLIMPDGVLGYSGSINFSAADVLSSLRKLQALKPDVVLPGHGPYGDPDRYIAAGIDVGTHVGWGKMPPEQPDPYFRLTQMNVQVVAWNLDAASADFGDIDGDGWPDVVVVVPADDEAILKLFLNHGGRFRRRPDHEIRVPGVAAAGKLRLRHLNDDPRPDFVVGGRTSAALLLSKGTWPDYQVEPLPLADLNQARRIDGAGGDLGAILVAARFGVFQATRRRPDGRLELTAFVPSLRSPYADLALWDVNADGRKDLVASAGEVYLRRADGRFAGEPDLRLPAPEARDWSFLAVGDFNADQWPDVALLSYGMQRAAIAVYYHTGHADVPYSAPAATTIDLEGGAAPRERHSLVRDTPPVADWDGDGIDDLIVGKGQDRRVLVLLGGRRGLDLTRSVTIPLDFRPHFETGLHVADFDGDHRLDLAAFGDTKTGVGAGGPPAVYIWTRNVRGHDPDSSE
jgi:glyoxylase-like metal-dependent hydrolase (beta-lactamase superfamily II)